MALEMPQHQRERVRSPGARNFARDQATSNEFHIDPQRGAASSGLKAIIAQGIEAAKGHAGSAQGRHRAVRKDRLAALNRAVEQILCGIAYARMMGGPDARLIVPLAKPRAKRNRYTPSLALRLADDAKALEATGWIVLDYSQGEGLASTATATEMLAVQLEAAVLSTDSFETRLDAEVIILRRMKSKEDRHWPPKANNSPPIDYVDRKESIRARSQLQAVNAFVASAAIGFEKPLGDLEKPVDTHGRLMRRHYALPEGKAPETFRFDLGGRLSGGWWMTIPKEDRQFITIDGEPTSELDFGSTAVRIAAIKAAKGGTMAIPSGLDPYDIVDGLGFGAIITDAERSTMREAVKGIVSAMLWDRESRTKFPKGMAGLFPQRLKFAEVSEAIYHRVGPSSPLIFGKGIGYKTNYWEAEVILEAITQLMSRRIAVLPVYDCIICPGSKVPEVRHEMLSACRKLLDGQELPVGLKR